MSDKIYMKPELLDSYIREMYIKSGLPEKDAGICAECTVRTNLWGIDSHGVLRTPAYIKRILGTAINAKPEIKALKGEEGPLTLATGDDGMGYVVASECMDMTIAKAKKFGIGIVVVNRSNHFGAASLFARKAANAGMLGIVTTNVIPNIGMPGNKQPVTGNNPLALAAPLPGPYPFSLDISMSAVAGGKILLAQKKGEKIPNTWAIDKDGHPTDDPFAGFSGILLPTGMHKGLGMSLFIDIVTGVLSGGPFLQNIRSMYKHQKMPSHTSHFFCAIAPDFFMDKNEFESRMQEWIRMIKATPMADEGAEQLIPGEIEYKMEKQRQKEGISLPLELINDLEELEKALKMNITLHEQCK